MHSVDETLMDKIRKTAWEKADEEEEEAKKEYLEEIIHPQHHH